MSKGWPLAILLSLAGSFWLGRLSVSMAPPEVTAAAQPAVTDNAKPTLAAANSQAGVTTTVSPSSPTVLQTLSALAQPLTASAPATLNLSGKAAYQQVSAVIDQAPPDQVSQQLQRFLSPAELQLIQNQKQFAQRLNDEFFGQRKAVDQPAQPRADLRISAGVDTPAASQDTVALTSPNQKIYAHLLNVEGPNRSDLVFVKWQDLDTDRVLLFDRKAITGAFNHNWVNLTPLGGWQPHRYQVTIYNVNDQMSVLAQQRYQVSLPAS